MGLQLVTGDFIQALMRSQTQPVEGTVSAHPLGRHLVVLTDSEVLHRLIWRLIPRVDGVCAGYVAPFVERPRQTQYAPAYLALLVRV